HSYLNPPPVPATEDSPTSTRISPCRFSLSPSLLPSLHVTSIPSSHSLTPFLRFIIIIFFHLLRLISFPHFFLHLLRLTSLPLTSLLTSSSSFLHIPFPSLLLHHLLLHLLLSHLLPYLIPPHFIPSSLRFTCSFPHFRLTSFSLLRSFHSPHFILFISFASQVLLFSQPPLFFHLPLFHLPSSFSSFPSSFSPLLPISNILPICLSLPPLLLLFPPLVLQPLFLIRFLPYQSFSFLNPPSLLNLSFFSFCSIPSLLFLPYLFSTTPVSFSSPYSFLPFFPSLFPFLFLPLSCFSSSLLFSPSLILLPSFPHLISPHPSFRFLPYLPPTLHILSSSSSPPPPPSPPSPSPPPFPLSSIPPPPFYYPSTPPP
ncbi:hypothetical protein C7M84_013619, partial [Penaeus vannamei]